jgi:hypothetical protein
MFNSTPSQRCRSSLLAPLVLTLSVAAAIAGCATETRSTAPGTLRPSSTFASPVGSDRNVSDNGGLVRMSDDVPVRVTNILVRAEIQFQGRIPYDNMTLPLVSPDGRFIATQTRVSPTWPTILAEWDASPPIATHIELYHRPPGSEQVRFHLAVGNGMILGRSYDDGGFLIEAPQDDGSRWIGYVAWETGDIQWLVADEFVNAFAVLGPDGRLAWSRRAVDEDDRFFELAVRGLHGRTWTYSTGYESWLMPMWSGRGDGLFAFALTDGYLEAVYAIASDESAFRQSQQRIGLAQNASVDAAYQAVGAQINSPSIRHHSMFERLTFFHPARMRMAVWQPIGGMRSGVHLLNRNSFAADIDEHGRALVTTEKNLIVQQFDQPADRAELLTGTLVPRPIRHDHWRYVLLGPSNGEVAIISMRPFVADAASAAPASR